MRVLTTFLAFAGMLSSAPAMAAPPVAVTENGKLEGMREPGLDVFLGIPYAAPPVGELRWKAPLPSPRWNGLRSARKFSPACSQDLNKPGPPYTAGFLNSGERSEDCLYLNVWAPARKGAKLPVYVFVHGGAFQIGGGDVPIYNGANLARRGAVVVTINYRLGRLGFFAHPDLSRESPLGVSGNYGTLDAIAALRWVKANIRSFGGDPARVTVAGQSAGAALVGSLLVSPLAEGLFQRAVLESGPIIGLPMAPLKVAEEKGVLAQTMAKAPDISALRAKTPDELKKVPLTAAPLPIIDGKIIPASPENPATRLASRVPVIIGFTRDEGNPATNPTTAAGFEAAVRKRYGALAERVLSIYPHATDAEAVRSGTRIDRDRRIAGLLLWAERRRKEGIPVYAYHFEHTFPGPQSDRLGAFHSSELPYVFGTFDIPDTSFEAKDRRISSEIQERWLAFMKTGAPTAGKGKGSWRAATIDPDSIWRVDPADAEPLLDAKRLELFREYEAQGGLLGLI